MRIEPREFAELHCGACHDKAGAAVLARRVVRCRSSFQSWATVFVFEYGRVLKRECVALETESRGGGTVRDQRCPENRCKTTARCHPERSEGSRTSWLVMLSRLCVPRSARDDDAPVGGARYQETSPHHFGERSTIPESHHRITIASNYSSFWLQ